MNVWVECGQCGHYHPAFWFGDCRDDKHRFGPEAIEKGDIVITLEEQMEDEGHEAR